MAGNNREREETAQERKSEECMGFINLARVSRALQLSFITFDIGDGAPGESYTPANSTNKIDEHRRVRRTTSTTRTKSTETSCN